MRDAFGKNKFFPDPARPRWKTIRTGILCPFCGEGQFYVGYDSGQTRWGIDPYYIGCTNNPRQGAICRWMEQTEQNGKAITETHAMSFKSYEGNPGAMATLLRQTMPELRRVRLEEWKPEKCILMYGPPSV